MTGKAKTLTVPDKNRLTDLVLQECKLWWESEGITIGLSDNEAKELDALIELYEKSNEAENKTNKETA